MTHPQRTLDHAGCRLAYTVRGDGPAVLLIQGVATQGDGWRPQVDDLAADHRCITFDNRGMGQSQPLAGKLTMAQMADDARAILDAEGCTSAHVVGHSMGGMIALHLALSAPERIRSLALLCTFARGRDVAPLSLRLLWLGLGTLIGTRRMRRRAFLRLVLSPDAYARVDLDAEAARLADLFGHDLGETPAIARQQLAALYSTDVFARLPELARTPTLVVSAVHDPISPPRVGRPLAAAIPGAVFHELTDASHGVTIQSPEVINRLLRQHFQDAKIV